jgi:DNA polymerase III epsilon subunit-like protein
MFLFFDVETTGLPSNLETPVSHLKKWPRVVQIAWEQYSEAERCIKSQSYIIKPDNFRISDESAGIHGISQERARSEGCPISTVLKEFSALIDESEFIIAHNLSFDEKVIIAEFIRAGLYNNLVHKNRICTMMASVRFCGITDFYDQFSYKWPKLEELHYKLFGSNIPESHNAKFDVNICSKCFFELVRRGVINIKMHRKYNSKQKNNNVIVQPNCEHQFSLSNSNKFSIKSTCLLDELNFYSKQGFDMVPIIRNGKKPIEKGWHTLHHKDKTEWAQWLKSGLNLGIKTGRASKITVLDLDSKNIPDIFMNYDFPILQKTQNGWHFVFQYDPNLPSGCIYDLKIDILNDRRQIVVSPSVVEGTHRHWYCKVEPESLIIPKMPKEIRSLIFDNMWPGRSLSETTEYGPPNIVQRRPWRS